MSAVWTDEDAEFWDHIIEYKGQLDLDAVHKELHDYRFVLSQVPEVYCHITNSMLSKPHYYAREVIAVADEYQDERFQERLDDAIRGVDWALELEGVKGVVSREQYLAVIEALRGEV